MHRLSFCFLLLLASPLSAQNKLDLNFQQSPPKPQPEWVKIVDQGQFDPRLKGYFTPEGIRVEIVAEAPTVVNPVGMTFDAKGDLYVLEWVPPPEVKDGKNVNFPESSVEFTYQDGSKRKVAIMKKPTKDHVKRLADTKGTGVYDEAKVILEDELPSSILIHDGWLYTSGQGTVRRVKMETLGTPEVRREVIAQGFCGFHHHQVSGLTLGNDGWLYITSGDDDNFVEGSDGSRADVLRTGAIFRCKPDGSKLHVYAQGFRNPYRDVAFDASFNMFHVDNDNEDGSKFTGCRLMHVAEGNDFGWRLRIGARCCVPDHSRAAVYGELPGKVPPMLKTGRGAPAGLLIYNDAYFPPEYRGLLYYPDVFRRSIRAYQVKRLGATFEVTHEFELMRSTDPLFRPCQMVTGPDGAMYVCDWRTDSGGAGKLWGDGKNGRIYRLTWTGTEVQPALSPRAKDSWEKIVQLGDKDLFRELRSDNFTDRQKAQQELVRRGKKHLATWLEVLESDHLPARIAAMGAVQSFWNDAVKTAVLERIKGGPDELRRLAAEAIALNVTRGDQETNDVLVTGLTEPSPDVLRAIVLAFGKVGQPGHGEALVNVLQFDKGSDVALRDGILRALESYGKEAFDQLLALADSGQAKDLEKLVEVYPAFRTRAAAVGIPGLLTNYHLTPENKADLIRAYNNFQVEPPVDLKPLADFLAKMPQANPDLPKKQRDEIEAMVPVKLAALEILANHGQLKAGKLSETLIDLLGAQDPAARLRVIKAIRDIRMTQAVTLLQTQLARTELASEKLALVETLGALSDRSAFAPIEKIYQAAETPADLRLASLRALIALDARRVKGFKDRLLVSDDPKLLEEAVVLLGDAPEGAKLLGEQFLAKKLPRALLPQVAEALRRFAREDAGSAALLSSVMKGGLLVALDAAEIGRIQGELSVKDRAQRGRSLYLNNRALACINCHRLEGVGGGPGPDLTRVWETHSLEKVMESMLDPSKEIKEGYQAYVAVTKAGKIHLGLKVAQNQDELTLKDAQGKEIKIAANDLDELSATKKSLMPDDVVRHLSYGEFLDLVAFLRDRAMQESLRGLGLDFVAKQASAADWKPIRAEPTGYVNLLTVVGKEETRALAKTFVYAPKEQKAKLLIGGARLLAVRIAGAEVYRGEPKFVADAESAEVTLPMGWSEVEVRAVSDDQVLGFFLRLQGDGLRLHPNKE